MNLEGVGQAAVLKGVVARANDGRKFEAVMQARKRVHALVERLLKALEGSAAEEDKATCDLARALSLLQPESRTDEAQKARKLVEQRLDEIASPSNVLAHDEKRDLMIILALGCGKLNRDVLARAYTYLTLDDPKTVTALARTAFPGFDKDKT